MAKFEFQSDIPRSKFKDGFREYAESLGFRFALGAMMAVSLVWLVGIGIGAIGAATWDRWRPTAATDAGWRHRSGLKLYTDHGTGCQYVSTGGDIIPRLGRDGQPVCGGAK